MNMTKRILSLLLLLALLFAVPVSAAPESESSDNAPAVTDTAPDPTSGEENSGIQEKSSVSGVISVRAIYKTVCEALGEDYFYLYANCLAFPIASIGHDVYYLTDATLYDFPAVITASRESIKSYFEENHISGLDMTDYAGEFNMTGANIEAIIGNNTYAPRLLYASDTYAIIVIANAPESILLNYSEQSFAGEVTYYKLSGQAFGLSAEPSVSTLSISAAKTIFSESDDGKTLTASDTILLRSAGSPLLTPAGVVCGFAYCEAESGEPHLTGLEGLSSKFKELGITTESVDISEEVIKAREAAQANAANADVLSSKKSSSSGSSKLLRNVVIILTVLTGLIIVSVITVVVLHNVNRKRRSQGKTVGKIRKPVVPASKVKKPVRPASVSKRTDTAKPAVKKSSQKRHPIPKHSRPKRPFASKPTPKKVPVTPPVPEKTVPVPQKSVSKFPPAAMLEVIDGPMLGITLTVSDSLIIGRDPAHCQIVFDESETSIAPQHCRLVYKPASGHLILEDLNSETGVYTPDGRRYTAGRRYLLHPGDKFYLGSEENMIEVCKQ